MIAAPIGTDEPDDSAEEFYDYVLAHGPEFVRGRQEADDAIARGELGAPLANVLAELDAEDRGSA